MKNTPKYIISFVIYVTKIK